MSWNVQAFGLRGKAALAIFQIVFAWRKLTSATDAGEFAALAAKRWFYYSREGATVASLAELRGAIRCNPRAELAFLLVASAQWAKRYKFLALAYCRRTWCHHLVLDFLAVRPGVLFANRPISGVGTGMLYWLAHLAESLGMETLWGEATASSAGFYEKVLQTRPIKDLFIIDRQGMRGIPPPTPTNVRVKRGEQSCTILPQCDAVTTGGVRMYEAEWTLDPSNGSWNNGGAFPNSRAMQLNGLPRAKDVWVRVRVQGTNGPSAWSDPATILVS
jgi:hypothetical protein